MALYPTRFERKKKTGLFDSPEAMGSELNFNMDQPDFSEQPKKEGALSKIKRLFTAPEAQKDEFGIEKPKEQSKIGKVLNYLLPMALTYGQGEGILPGLVGAYFGSRKRAKGEQGQYEERMLKAKALAGKEDDTLERLRLEESMRHNKAMETKPAEREKILSLMNKYAKAAPTALPDNMAGPEMPGADDAKLRMDNIEKLYGAKNSIYVPSSDQIFDMGELEKLYNQDPNNLSSSEVEALKAYKKKLKGIK